jgi:hypothetical protein
MTDKFQILVCDVALDGDIRQNVHRGVDNPVTYPERLLLEFIHGPDSVTEIRDIGTVERPMRDERTRLGSTYGDKVVSEVFPGHAAVARLPFSDSSITSFDRAPRGVQKTPEAKKAAKATAEKRAAEIGNDEQEPVVSPDTEDEPVPVVVEPVDTSIDGKV